MLPIPESMDHDSGIIPEPMDHDSGIKEKTEEDFLDSLRFLEFI